MRDCGDCIACCTYLRIEEGEFSKQGMHHCKFAMLPRPEESGKVYYTGKNPCHNCSAHGSSERPLVCEQYNCLWKYGHGNEEDRPDKSLLLIDRTKKVENAIEVKPLADGVEDTREGREVIKRFSRSYDAPAIVLSFYERRVKRVDGEPA